MKQNENVISLKTYFDEDKSLTGIGDDEGKLIYSKLVSFITQKPEFKIFYISIKDCVFESSFARESLVRLAKDNRKNLGICLLDADSEMLRLNLLAPVFKLNQPMAYYIGDHFDHISQDKIGAPSKTNKPIFDFVFKNGLSSASQVADYLDMKVNNASTKLKALYEEGFLLRPEDKSDTGGVEYKYFAIK